MNIYCPICVTFRVRQVTQFHCPFVIFEKISPGKAVLFLLEPYEYILNCGFVACTVVNLTGCVCVGVCMCGSVYVWECVCVGVCVCGSVYVWECVCVGVCMWGSVYVWECVGVGVCRCGSV
jgi:hypothetical protein